MNSRLSHTGSPRNNGPVAQGIEQLPSKQSVERSNRSRITRIRDVAQVVAHLVWDQRVARSNRVIPTVKLASVVGII